jgi:tRNA A37 threonylcarbamoyltransferase TsaD
MEDKYENMDDLQKSFYTITLLLAEIEKTAKLGNPIAIKFPRPMLATKSGRQQNYQFSFWI